MTGTWLWRGYRGGKRRDQYGVGQSGQAAGRWDVSWARKLVSGEMGHMLQAQEVACAKARRQEGALYVCGVGASWAVTRLKGLLGRGARVDEAGGQGLGQAMEFAKT